MKLKIRESKRIADRESNPWHARSYEEILDLDNLSFITWQDLPNYAGQYVFNTETKRPVRVYGDNLFPEYEDEYGIRHPFEYSDFIDKKTWAKLPERKDKIVGRSIEEAIKDGLPESLIPDEYKAVR